MAKTSPEASEGHKEDKLLPLYSSAAPPFPTALQASTYTLPMKRSLGINTAYKHFYCLAENGQNTWFFPRGQVNEVAREVLDAIFREPAVVEKIKENFLNESSRLLDLLKPEPDPERYKDLSNDEILKTFNKAVELYMEATYWLEPPNFTLEIRGHDLLKEKFYSFAKRKNPAAKESELSDQFAVLSNPTKKSFAAESELGLLKIALLQEKESAIKEHAQKYYWQLYDYFGPILDEKTVKEELKKIGEMPKEKIRKRIEKIDSFESIAEQKLGQALDKAALPEELANVFAAMRELAFLNGDIKKKRISEANVALGMMLKELGKRTGIKEDVLHYSTVGELQKLLAGKTLNPQIFKGRMHKGCIVVEKGDYYFLSQEQTKEIELQTSGKDKEPVELIKGMSACPGYYRGRARVILDKESLSGFEQGEVLVTQMTAVDYVPVMKKSGAIVTDLGGITCHAAIVSRELGIPCIVGTGNATKTIRTGNVVEVKANHGIVRVLEGK